MGLCGQDAFLVIQPISKHWRKQSTYPDEWTDLIVSPVYPFSLLPVPRL